VFDEPTGSLLDLCPFLGLVLLLLMMEEVEVQSQLCSQLLRRLVEVRVGDMFHGLDLCPFLYLVLSSTQLLVAVVWALFRVWEVRLVWIQLRGLCHDPDLVLDLCHVSLVNFLAPIRRLCRRRIPQTFPFRLPSPLSWRPFGQIFRGSR